MCTAITYTTKNHYFGRNFDLEYSYNETVTITPRNFPFKFRRMPEIKKHYSMIGMAYVFKGYPLYYEATNEKGLSMASLNYPEYAHYNKVQEGKDNIATFEFIPWIVCQCENVDDAKKLLEKINITDEQFDESLPNGTLHWIIADKEASITVESDKDGLKIYDNPMGVLTNSPSFNIQLVNLSNYLSVTSEQIENRFSDKITLTQYSRGMGGIGLPGDLSSMSRFVKVAFTKLNSVCGDGENESVSQFFHILGSVEQQNGCVCMGNGKFERTIYSCCCNVDYGIYYYITYNNSMITAISMYNENIDSRELVSYPLICETQIKHQN